MMGNIKTISSVLHGLLNKKGKKDTLSVIDTYDIEVSPLWSGCRNKEELQEIILKYWAEIFQKDGPPATKMEVVKYFNELRKHVFKDNDNLGATIPSYCSLGLHENGTWKMKIMFPAGLELCSIKWRND